MPAELDRFNWGAFFFPVLWPLAKGPIAWAGIFFGVSLVSRLLFEITPDTWWLFGLIVGIAELGLGIWYARNANRLLWEKTPWNVDPEKHLRSQRKWGGVGLLINCVFLMLGLLLVLSAIE